MPLMVAPPPKLYLRRQYRQLCRLRSPHFFRRNFSTSCLTENSSVRLATGTKFKPLLRTGLSKSESSRFSGMVTTVMLLFSNDGS